MTLTVIIMVAGWIVGDWVREYVHLGRGCRVCQPTQPTAVVPVSRAKVTAEAPETTEMEAPKVEVSVFAWDEERGEWGVVA